MNRMCWLFSVAAMAALLITPAFAVDNTTTKDATAGTSAMNKTAADETATDTTAINDDADGAVEVTYAIGVCPETGAMVIEYAETGDMLYIEPEIIKLMVRNSKTKKMVQCMMSGKPLYLDPDSGRLLTLSQQTGNLTGAVINSQAAYLSPDSTKIMIRSTTTGKLADYEKDGKFWGVSSDTGVVGPISGTAGSKASSGKASSGKASGNTTR